jgi:hypothetical protein
MKRLIGCAAALFLSGCAMTDPNQVEDVLMPGTVAFDFTGAGMPGSTRFDATGLISSSNPEWGTTPLAVSRISSSVPIHTIVVGGIPTSPARWDQILLNLDRASVGTATIPTVCRGICSDPLIQVEFNASHALNPDVPAYICIISSGTLTITSISDRRVAGTFSGTGLCTNPGNGQSPFTVTNGVFDVGILVSGKQLPGA